MIANPFIQTTAKQNHLKEKLLKELIRLTTIDICDELHKFEMHELFRWLIPHYLTFFPFIIFSFHYFFLSQLKSRYTTFDAKC